MEQNEALAKKFDVPKSLLDYITKVMQEETEYQNKVKAHMAKKGIKSLRDLSPEEKKKFFNDLDALHTSKNEAVTNYNPKSQGGTRKELLAKFAETGNPKDAEAARKAGASRDEIKNAAANAMKRGKGKKGSNYLLSKNEEIEQIEEVEEIDERNKENAEKRKAMDAARGSNFKAQGYSTPSPSPQHKTNQAHDKSVGRAIRKMSREEVEEIDERNKENAEKRKAMDAARGSNFKAQGYSTPSPSPQHKTNQAHDKSVGRAIRKMSREDIEYTDEAVVKGKGYDNPDNVRKAPEGKVPMTSLMPGHSDKAARFAAIQAKGKLVKGIAQSAPQKENYELTQEDLNFIHSLNEFTSQQLAKMRDEYGKINTIDPSGPAYKQLIAMLDKMNIDNLKTLAGAKIKFVSGLAQNRINRASMKKEEEEPKNEASSPAQQAAIAIAMKKAGKKPKNESIAAKYLKQIKKDKLQEAEGEKEKKNDKEVSVKQKTFKKGETLSGKREPIQINPQINEK
jgi:hypothetical protein